MKTSASGGLASFEVWGCDEVVQLAVVAPKCPYD